MVASATLVWGAGAIDLKEAWLLPCMMVVTAQAKGGARFWGLESQSWGNSASPWRDCGCHLVQGWDQGLNCCNCSPGRAHVLEPHLQTEEPRMNLWLLLCMAMAAACLVRDRPEQECAVARALVQTAALAGCFWSCCPGISGSFQSAASCVEVGASIRASKRIFLVSYSHLGNPLIFKTSQRNTYECCTDWGVYVGLKPWRASSLWYLSPSGSSARVWVITRFLHPTSLKSM